MIKDNQTTKQRARSGHITCRMDSVPHRIAAREAFVCRYVHGKLLVAECGTTFYVLVVHNVVYGAYDDVSEQWYVCDELLNVRVPDRFKVKILPKDYVSVSYWDLDRLITNGVAWLVAFKLRQVAGG